MLGTKGLNCNFEFMVSQASRVAVILVCRYLCLSLPQNFQTALSLTSKP